MDIPNITLSFLAQEIKPLLEGAKIRSIQELPNNWLKITLFKRPKNLQLIIAGRAVFAAKKSFPAKQETSGFGAFLRKQLSGKTISQIWQNGFDRVVVFEIEEFFLVAELFAKGNIVLADKEKKILSVQRTEFWKDRELKKNSPYIFPAGKEFSPEAIDSGKLHSFFRECRGTAITCLLKKTNIAPAMAEEAFFLSGISKEKQASSITEKEAEKIAVASKELYSLTQKASPVICEGKEEILLPFPINSLPEKQKIGSINGFLDDYFSRQLQNAPSLASKEKSSKTIALQKSLEKQLEEKQRLEQEAEESTKKGEAIFSHYTQIKEALEKAQKGIMYKNGFSVKQIGKKSRKVLVEL